jgi:hypothetical protein
MAFTMHPRFSYHGVLVFDGLPQTLKLIFVVVDHRSLVTNFGHDGRKCILVGLAAEEDNFVTRRESCLGGVELVTTFTRRENNMAGSKEKDPIVFAAFAKVETAGAFGVRVGFGSDSEAECGSEWGA